jgi:hypothetical protein
VIRTVTKSLAAFRVAIAWPIPTSLVDHPPIPHWLAPPADQVKAN